MIKLEAAPAESLRLCDLCLNLILEVEFRLSISGAIAGRICRCCSRSIAGNRQKMLQVANVIHSIKSNRTRDIRSRLSTAFPFLSDRIISRLIHAGYRSAWDFDRISDADMLRIRGIGIRTLKRIRAPRSSNENS